MKKLTLLPVLILATTPLNGMSRLVQATRQTLPALRQATRPGTCPAGFRPVVQRGLFTTSRTGTFAGGQQAAFGRGALLVGGAGAAALAGKAAYNSRDRQVLERAYAAELQPELAVTRELVSNLDDEKTNYALDLIHKFTGNKKYTNDDMQSLFNLSALIYKELNQIYPEPTLDQEVKLLLENKSANPLLPDKAGNLMLLKRQVDALIKHLLENPTANSRVLAGKLLEIVPQNAIGNTTLEAVVHDRNVPLPALVSMLYLNQNLMKFTQLQDDLAHEIAKRGDWVVADTIINDFSQQNRFATILVNQLIKNEPRFLARRFAANSYYTPAFAAAYNNPAPEFDSFRKFVDNEGNFFPHGSEEKEILADIKRKARYQTRTAGTTSRVQE